MASLQATQGINWEGREARELIKLSWPITVSTLSYSAMTLVDTLLVGRLGAAELAGVGLGGVAAFVFLCFSFGLLRGAKTLVSQAVGAGRRDQIGAYLGAAVMLALGIGVITVGAGQVVARLVGLLADDAAAGRAASTYLSIRILGAPFALLYVALREVRYGQSDARTPMIATVAANAVNIALASLFIYAFHWGVAGAAWATVIAHVVEAGVLVVVQHWEGWGVRATRMAHVRAVWRIGLPTGIQFTLEVGAFAMLTALIARMGVMQMAGHQIAIQVIHFSFLPAFAVGEAASVLAGQAVGAHKLALVNKVARVALGVTAVYTFAWTLIMAFAAPLIVTGFTGDAALARVAVSLLHVAAIFQVFDGANIVARGVLRGAGDVRVPAVVGVVTSWVATPPLAWLLGFGLGMGALGGWIGLTVEIFASTAILWWRLEKNTWHAAAGRSRDEVAAAAGQVPASVPASSPVAPIVEVAAQG